MGSISSPNGFPGFARLYWLHEPGAGRYFRADIDFRKNALKVTRGEILPEQPVLARWFMGGLKPVDIVRTGYVAPLLISDRVLALFHEHGFTGWSTYRVELSGKTGESIPGYHGLSVHGRCGPIDDSRSQQVPKQFPKKVSMILKGLYLDPATWDGSDLFMPEGGWGYILVTEAVKGALEKAKVKNVVFTPLDEVERDILQTVPDHGQAN